jgi:hypothetical protein
MAGGSPTLWGLVISLTGKPELALATVAFALGTFLVVLRHVDVLDSLDRVAVSLTAWFLVVPYLSTADPILLAVAWSAILRRGLVPQRSIGLLVLLVVAANLVPWALYATKEPAVADIRNALVIPVTAALLAVALRRRTVAAAAASAPPMLEFGRVGAAGVRAAHRAARNAPIRKQPRLGAPLTIERGEGFGARPAGRRSRIGLRSGGLIERAGSVARRR